LSVQVLEAQPWVGGRLNYTTLPNGYGIDNGGQWFGPMHTSVLQLLEELNLTYYTSPLTFDGITASIDGQRVSVGLSLGINVSEWAGFWDEAAWADAAQALIKFQVLAATMPKVEYPYHLSKEWLDLDSQSLLSWIRENTHTEKGARIFEQLHRFKCGPPTAAAASLLDTLWQDQSGPLVGEGNPMELLVQGGAGQIPERLAAKMKLPVKLGDPVVHIGQADGVAHVQTMAGKVYHAKHVVVAMGPYMSGRIDYSPPLPWQRLHLNQHTSMATVAKILVQYSTPFWRDDLGIAFVTMDDGPVGWCHDTSHPDYPEGTLGCFADQGKYDLLQQLPDDEAKKTAVLQMLAKYLGKAALTPVYFHIVDWPAEPWAQGGFGSYLGIQTWERFGPALVEPHGVIQWAGDVTSSKWAAWFEGGALSGKRAAQNIIDLSTKEQN